MPDTYTESKLQISLRAHIRVARVIQKAIESENTTPFQWGVLSQAIQSTEGILAEAAHLAKDISELARLTMKFDLKAKQLLEKGRRGTFPGKKAQAG